MSFNGATGVSGTTGSPFVGRNIPASSIPLNGTYGSSPEKDSREPSFFHGEALARDLMAERYGTRIVLGFTIAFILFLLGMGLTGQVAGKSFSLKSISDILQFVGEGIGFVFCLRIALRLRRVSTQLRRTLMAQGMHQRTRNEIAAARAEAQIAYRAYLAWTFLALAILLYAAGQAAWTSYDVRMNSAQVPFPGIYDIGFVASYPFFLIGTLLLSRRSKATVGSTRLLLDALAVIGASLALSWFFVLSPAIAGLSQAPSAGAAFLTIYFPAGDLFLVAVGAFLMFSSLANREQQPVLLRLCLGLFFLAITDSLLGYFNLTPSGFNTGTLQDILWPLSMMLVGLAAIEYPRSIAREQERVAQAGNVLGQASPLLFGGRVTQFGTTLQTITPFILALTTSAILLTIIAPRGGVVLIQADVIAFALVLVVVARQALTLLENNRLAMQMRGELVISKRELFVTRREAEEATRSAQEKQALEEGIAALQRIHAQVSRGNFAVRAHISAGPLLPIAVSLNLMLDRLSSLTQRGAAYEQLLYNIRLLQEALNRISQGQPFRVEEQHMPQIATDLRPIFMQLSNLQRAQQGQLQRLGNSVTSMNPLLQRLHEALAEVRSSKHFNELEGATAERVALERAVRVEEQIEQMQKALLTQIASSATHVDEHLSTNPHIDQSALRHQSQSQQQQSETWQPPRRAGGINIPRSSQNQ